MMTTVISAGSVVPKRLVRKANQGRSSGFVFLAQCLDEIPAEGDQGAEQAEDLADASGIGVRGHGPTGIGVWGSGRGGVGVGHAA
jgi:hypothetical protein